MVIPHPVTLSMEIELLLQKELFPARTEATDNSNVTRKARATKGMMARRSDSEATTLAVAFGTALWQSPAPNLDPSTAHLTRGVSATYSLC